MVGRVREHVGHCENVGQTSDGRPAFIHAVPCALEVNDQFVFFNMAGIPDGPASPHGAGDRCGGKRNDRAEPEVVVGRGACNGTCGDHSRRATRDARLLKPITRHYARSGLKSRQRVAKIVGDAATLATTQSQACGLPLLPHVTPHSLRRTYISIALVENNFESQVGNEPSRPRRQQNDPRRLRPTRAADRRCTRHQPRQSRSPGARATATACP
jgi:hypothetical protein